MENYVSLNVLDTGQYGIIKELRNTGSMRRRLLDIGLTKNTVIECIGKSPCGDPCAYLIRGAVIAIRSEDCADIIVRVVQGGADNGSH